MRRRTTRTSRSIISTSSVLLVHVCIFLLPRATVLAQVDAQANTGSSINNNNVTSCYISRNFDAQRHKQVYSVGVLAIRGFEAAFAEFNATFADYLTAAVGARFSNQIRFQMVPLNFLSLFDKASNVDFIYVNPSAYSCMESEHDAISLVSQISKRVVGGKTHHLNKFGGVMAVRAENTEIYSLADLKDKIVAAASISGLGSGQMQFREMQNAGLSYLSDPKQLVLTSNQGKVVRGVLSGEFDVGFVRTDQIERSTNKNGDPVNTTLLRILNPQESFNSDGTPFPFTASTPLYPEWNLAALSNVAQDVSTEVQQAMLAIADHAEALDACEDDNSTHCENYSPKRCDTTERIALLAKKAKESGRYSAWTPTLSYMMLRDMQQSTGFIRPDSSNVWRCIRSEELYDFLSCPDGLEKKTAEEVSNACAAAGLPCKEGYQCICKPCYEPFQCDDSVEILGSCVDYRTLMSGIFIPFVVLSLMSCFGVVWYKSSQLVKQASIAAQKERELNEFIAHEVRNPLSAAISAITFLKVTVQGDKLCCEESKTIREDVDIIDCSLRFINDLLRSILDDSRAASDQMVLEKETVGLLHDILEPVASMLYTRDMSFDVLLDCSPTLAVNVDRLRLQQVILNLARNAAKFVTEGFIRLRAHIKDGNVILFVEDSGPGIPTEKRNQLFSRFQKSLDSLAQGTGVGLHLCMNLVDLMGGDLSLDEEYNSGRKGFPGTRIVVNLRSRPEAVRSMSARLDTKQMSLPTEIRSAPINNAIPPNLAILLVDDDRVLRKQATRAMKRLEPRCTVREAASGEAALQIIKSESFDIIFMDHYMTSVDQSLTGIETTRALRAEGVRSVICGLSANNLKEVYLKNGAEAFHLKPFPCKESELRSFLLELIAIQAASFTERETSRKGDTV